MGGVESGRVKRGAAGRACKKEGIHALGFEKASGKPEAAGIRGRRRGENEGDWRRGANFEKRERERMLKVRGGGKGKVLTSGGRRLGGLSRA